MSATHNAPARGATAAPRSPGPDAPDVGLARSERRRTELRSVLSRCGTNPTQFARRVGLTRANALYNFPNGRSDAFSLDTVEAILGAFPDLTFEELVGWPPRRLVLTDAAELALLSSPGPTRRPR